MPYLLDILLERIVFLPQIGYRGLGGTLGKLQRLDFVLKALNLLGGLGRFGGRMSNELIALNKSLVCGGELSIRIVSTQLRDQDVKHVLVQRLDCTPGLVRRSAAWQC